MKIVLIKTITAIIVSVFSCSSFGDSSAEKFIALCLNPNETQRHTLNAIIKSESDLGTQKQICEDITSRHILPSFYNIRTNLSLPDKDITDLSPLQYFRNLSSLDLTNNNEIENWNYLADLINLETLYINDNGITDTRFFKGLKNLQQLYATENPFDNIENILSLTTLKGISLSNLPQAVDISSVPKGMVSLNIWDTEIKNICALNALKSLSNLSLTENNLTAIDCPLKLPELERISIYKNPISNVEFARTLPKLAGVALGYTNVSSIEPLTGKRITYLKIDNSPITDLSPLAGDKGMGVVITENVPLLWCSPKSAKEIVKGVSCLDENGKEKSWWQRLLRI